MVFMDLCPGDFSGGGTFADIFAVKVEIDGSVWLGTPGELWGPARESSHGR